MISDNVILSPGNVVIANTVNTPHQRQLILTNWGEILQSETPPCPAKFHLDWLGMWDLGPRTGKKRHFCDIFALMIITKFLSYMNAYRLRLHSVVVTFGQKVTVLYTNNYDGGIFLQIFSGP